jgi:hypothetical protein
MMKLFGSRGERPSADSAKDGFLQSRWFRTLLTFCSVLVVVAVCIEIYRRANNYGARVVEARPVEARIEILNPPAWLDRRIITALLDESYAFAQKDEATYDRARNILDNEVLHEIADLYTGSDTVDGKSVSRQTHGYNAWISGITEVRREIAKDNSMQTITIRAQWRSPMAWVRAGDSFYLIDADGVRLPGEYPAANREARLMVLTGIDQPMADGKPAVPQPGETWTGGTSGQRGEDQLAGMKLIATLRGRAFAGQIDAIDLANFKGRKDPLAAWILLDTIWRTANGTPRVIQWGRPVGQEIYYEVPARAKLQALDAIYERFKRIDAGRDSVDVRWEGASGSKMASDAEEPQLQAARG